MTVERIPAMMEKLEYLTAGMARLESLISKEIQDLKSEQIADLKRQLERLADDQRQSWNAIRSIENAGNQYDGGVKAVHAIVAAVCGLFGAGAAALISRLIH